jgi:hypothetical protein
LNTASIAAIKQLKDANKNLESFCKFETFEFSKERISFLVDEVSQVSKNMKISSVRFSQIKIGETDERLKGPLKKHDEENRLREIKG